MLTIERLKSLHDCRRKFKVYIDDKMKATIKNGDIYTIELTEGEHTIKLKVDWCSSCELKFIYKEGDDIAFDCYPILRGSYKLFSIRNITINRHAYITLQEKQQF